MIYHFKGLTKDINFNDFIDVKTLFDDIKSKKTILEHVEKNQMEFKSELSSASVWGNKSCKHLSEIKNISKCYKSPVKVIKFHIDYFKMVHKPACDVKHRNGLKTLTPKQMLKRLPIALAQLKAGKISEKLYILCIEKNKLLKKYMII